MAKRKHIMVFAYNDDYLQLRFTSVEVNGEASLLTVCVVLKSLSSQLFEKSKTLSAPGSKP